jgi:uncharacterized protein YlxP (DUF503 family)
MDDVRVHTATLVLDLRLPGAASLKDRRKGLHALVERLRRADYAVAQVGPADLRERAFLAVAAVAGSPARLDERLDGAERLAFASEFEVLVMRRDGESWSGRSL